MRGVEESAEAAGIQVLLVRSERLPSGSDHLRRLMGEGRVDGFLLQRADDTDESLLDAIAEGSMPVVLINSRGRGRGSVVLDDGLAPRAAVRTPGGAGPPGNRLHRCRRAQLCRQQSERGSPRPCRRPVCVPYRLDGPPRHRAGGRSPVDPPVLLGRRSHVPLLCVVADVKAAVGVLEGARQLGLRVPEDLSVVSIHDTWVAEFSSPPLTTVACRCTSWARAALQQLLSRLDGSDPSRRCRPRPDPELVQARLNSRAATGLTGLALGSRRSGGRPAGVKRS